MKRILAFSVVCLFSLGLIATSDAGLFAQDAKAMQVLEKMIEAMGGRATMQAVKDMTATGTMAMPSMGLEAPATLYTKKENKFRMDIEFMGTSITSAYDGEAGWVINPQTGAVEDLPGEQLEETKRMAMGDSAYLDPEKYGIVYTSKGQEKLEDKDYDAASIANSVKARMIKRDVIKEDQVKVIYKSQTFPTTGYGHAHNLHPVVTAKIKEAFFNFDWNYWDFC